MNEQDITHRLREDCDCSMGDEAAGEIDFLRELVDRLAPAKCITDYYSSECVWCGFGPDCEVPENHGDDCPWAQARKYLQETKSDSQ